MINAIVLCKDAEARNRWFDKVIHFKDVIKWERTEKTYRYFTKLYDYRVLIYAEDVLCGERPDLVLYDERLFDHIGEFFMHSKFPPQEITI
jgi:hypothetical protein